MSFSFKLTSQFVDKYKHRKAPFGFGALGELTFLRTYSRIKPDGKNEKWWEVIERVVNGTYSIQKDYVENLDLEWNAWRAQKSAQQMYDIFFNMKALPPGRGLWAMGTVVTQEKKLFMCLNNCSFISTKKLNEDPSMPFAFLMDLSMLGVGVGFDTKGDGLVKINGANARRKEEIFEVPDTREGWVESLKLLLDSYFFGTQKISFDYSKIRPAGKIIKTFGGISSGPGPLIDLHKNIRKLLKKEIGQPLSSTSIVDIMNLIGKAVISGNLRRTAEIAIGDPNDEEYLDLKDYNKNPQRAEFGWTSNNSVFAELGMDYSVVTERIKNNGEPGLVWLRNMRKYGRMCDNPNRDLDPDVDGVNPCSEQSLSSGECCNLVETFPTKHKNLDDYLKTLKYAYLYAKTVTLCKTHWKQTNQVMLKNHRIGCSMSGLAQFVQKNGLHELKNWMQNGYNTIRKWDIIYSDWLVTRESIKVSSLKPSGSCSLLVGATAGMHWPESRYYIRRIRIAKNSQLIEPIKKAGYKTEIDVNDANSIVVEIPIDIGPNIRLLKDISMWEQLSFAAFIQKYWADNQVSCSVTFDPKTEGDQIKPALEYFQYQLKGISFLPRIPKGVYPQMPYEEITEQQYKNLTKNQKKIIFGIIKNEQADVEKFCDGDSCVIQK